LLKYLQNRHILAVYKGKQNLNILRSLTMTSDVFYIGLCDRVYSALIIGDTHQVSLHDETREVEHRAGALDIREKVLWLRTKSTCILIYIVHYTYFY